MKSWAYETEEDEDGLQVVYGYWNDEGWWEVANLFVPNTEPIAYLIERQGDRTFPRLVLKEEAGDWIRAAGLSSRMTLRPLYAGQAQRSSK